MLALAAGLGLGLAAEVAAAALIKSAAEKIKIEPRRDGVDRIPLAVQRMMAQRTEETEGLPPWAKNWLNTVSRRLERAGVKIPVGRYLAGVFLAAAAGVIVGIGYLDNFPAAAVLAAAAFFVPDSLLVGRIQRERQKMINQLGSTVRLFAAEFADTPQVLRALSRTAANVPPPLGKVLQRAVNDLTSGQDKDEVLARLMRELDFEYGKMFVQLLRIAWEDAAVRPLFSRLAVRIAGLQELIQKNQAQVFSGRWVAMLVNIMVVPMFFIVRWLVPGAEDFLTAHPVGRIIVFLSFTSVLVGLLLDRVLTEVDV